MKTACYFYSNIVRTFPMLPELFEYTPAAHPSTCLHLRNLAQPRGASLAAPQSPAEPAGPTASPPLVPHRVPVPRSIDAVVWSAPRSPFSPPLARAVEFQKYLFCVAWTVLLRFCSSSASSPFCLSVLPRFCCCLLSC